MNPLTQSIPVEPDPLSLMDEIDPLLHWLAHRVAVPGSLVGLEHGDLYGTAWVGARTALGSWDPAKGPWNHWASLGARKALGAALSDLPVKISQDAQRALRAEGNMWATTGVTQGSLPLGDSSMTLEDTFPDTPMVLDLDHHTLDKALARLQARTARIIKAHLGWGTHDPLGFSLVAAQEGLSEYRTREIYREGIKGLRRTITGN